MIQESKLSSNSKTPSIQNFTTVRKDCRQGQGGGLLTLIHKSINFSRKPESPETLVEPHLEELTITATLGDTELIITNVYIQPSSSCAGSYLPSLDHLMMTMDTQTPHQHCRHPPTLTLSQHTHMQHKQQYMHHSHRNNRTHNIGYYDNLTNRPRTTTGLLTPHKHTGPAVKVREISSYCKST